MGRVSKHGGLIAAILYVFVIQAWPGAAFQAPAPAAPQTPPAAQDPNARPPRRVGGFVPGQQRPQEDPVQIAHGKTLYDINCRACHGADLRGGDMGGPNLLRSPVALGDKKGELIVPIIHGSRQAMGMPAIGISTPDAEAVAMFVRSVVGTIGVQGMPPSAGREPPSILVGNADEGKAYFAVKCANCHSATGDLAGIASRIADARVLQTRWVGAGRRGERRRTPGPPAPVATAKVTLPSGEIVSGALVHIDNFLLTIKMQDESLRSFRRDGDIPKVEIDDPVEAHRSMLSQYTDKDIHDVTAYLVTLK